MPKQYKRRVYRKRKGGAKKAYRRPGQRMTTSGRAGYMNVSRRAPLMSIQDGGAVGTVSVNDPTSSCITLGTPVAVPSGLAGLYDVPFTMKFSLSQLSAYSEFTALFDSYKINSVKVYFKAFYNSTTVTSVGLPSIEYVTDHDDANVITPSQMRERVGSKHKWFNATKNVALLQVRPRCGDLVQSSASLGTNALATNNRAMWIDCSNPGVEHYAIKGVIRNMYVGGSAGANQFQIDVIPNVSFKGVI